MFKKLTLFYLFTLNLLMATIVSAGVTGKISGRVTEASSGETLPGANVVLKNTSMGAAADLDGNFVILNVSPGVYSVQVSMMGYGSIVYENIRVSIDLTTKVDFQLSEEILESGETVTVFAQRELVQKDLTASTAILGTEEIAALPIAEITDAIELQAGIVSSGGSLHIRGGRSGEIGYWVDGIPVTDVFDGGTVINFNKDAVQELQVISGAFNAEYGQAQSGIINIATKEGSNIFGGSVSSYAGDHLSKHDKIFFGIDDFDPVDTHNFELSLHGPIIKDKLFYFVNGRRINRGGHNRGRRKFLPEDFYSVFQSNIIFEQAVARDDNGNPLTNSDGSLLLLPTDPNNVGDNEIVDMGGSEEIFAQAKLVYRLTPSIKLSYIYLKSDKDFQDFDRQFILNPDGAKEKFQRGNTHIAKWTHALSSRTFYDFGFSFFTKTFEDKTFEGLDIQTDASGAPILTDAGGILIENPNQYVHPIFLTDLTSFSFHSGGTDLKRFRRETKTTLGKFDITSQVTNNHQIKTGIEFRQHNIFFQDIDLRPVETGFDPFVTDTSGQVVGFASPYVDFQILPVSSEFTDRYRHKPIEFSGYIQDKMEFESMIVNIGVRFDHFDPDGIVLTDESDPNIFEPIKPSNRFNDLDGNGFQDPGETSLTVADREKYWFKKAGTKTRISPRIGIAFPITDQGVFHFSYGHFVQIPNFQRLYQNPEFELGSGTGNQGTIGNTDLDPEFTISGEIGLQQQIGDNIGMDIAIFFRDIRDLAGTASDEIEVFGGSQTYSKIVNSDFGFVRGVVLSLTKRFNQGFSANMDYTFQIAKATNSDPEATRDALAAGTLPEIQLTTVGWDQLHTFNANLTYSRNTWGGSLLFQYGSGQPFTPRADVDVSTLQTNSERKPAFSQLDLRAFYGFDLPGNFDGNLFLRVFNIFDTLNEINVFDDTGDASFTTDLQRAVRTNAPDLVNTKEQFFTNQTHFSEPRRIELGLSVDF